MRRAAAASILFVILLTAASWNAGGYSYTGHRWAASQVPFYVNPVSKYMSENAAISTLQAAADHWRTQSGANIRYYYAGRTSGTSLKNNGINEVFFRNTSNGSYAGLTYYWYGSDGKLVDADTVFYEGSYRLFPGSSGCSNGVYLEDLATHEFGHALGLGHSGVSGATMYSTMSGWCSQAWRTLSSDDISGIRAAYGTSTSSAPAAPSGLVATAGPNPQSEVRLTWSDRSTNESGFAIERSTNGTSFARIGQTGANVTSVVNYRLSPSTRYWYRVRAFNSAGSSSASNTVSITTAGSASTLSPPAAPSNPSPTHGATNVRTSSVSWAASSGAKTYDVYFGLASSPPLVSAGQTTTSWSTGRLESGRRYYWRVVAKNTAGATGSSVWSFTTRAKSGGGKGRK